jgi:hypothetical protein
MYPSFFALAFGGITIAVALILLVLQQPLIYVGITLLFSIAISGHGMLHHIYERYHAFNPLHKITFPQ